MARKPDTASRALDAALKLAATTGWQAMSLAARSQVEECAL